MLKSNHAQFRKGGILIRNAFSFILLFFYLLTLLVPAENAAIPDIATEALPTEIRDTRIKACSAFAEPLPGEPYHTPIISFDVSENGYVLCCSGSSIKGNEILVYDHDGMFLYGFTFDPVGSYSITLEDDGVVLYLSRSYLAVIVDETGGVTDVRNIVDDTDNLNRMRKLMDVKSILYDGYTYEVRKDSGVQLFPGYAYNKLIRTDQNGQELVLYDATDDAQNRLLFIAITVPLLIGILLFIIIRSLIQTSHQKLPTSNNESEENP